MSSGSAPASVSVVRRIDWADTDMAGICHYPVFARLADAAESLLYDRLDLMDAFLKLPRRALEVEFLQPLYFNDIVRVDYRISRVGRTSVTSTFAVRRDETVALRGTMTSTLIDEERPVPWPEEWLQRLMTAGDLGVEDVVYAGARAQA